MNGQGPGHHRIDHVGQHPVCMPHHIGTGGFELFLQGLGQLDPVQQIVVQDIHDHIRRGLVFQPQSSCADGIHLPHIPDHLFL